jgi:hypothetical protein
VITVKHRLPWNFPITAALEYNILIAVQGTYRVNSAELYRANAAECVAMASSMTDASNRASLLNMASAWLRLAELAEKNGRTESGLRDSAATASDHSPDSP